jgi:hypothetical protein
LAVVRNNLIGTWNMTHAVATLAMIPQQKGSVVNVIAQIKRGFPGMVHTGAARAGVDVRLYFAYVALVSSNSLSSFSNRTSRRQFRSSGASTTFERILWRLESSKRRERNDILRLFLIAHLPSRPFIDWAPRKKWRT